MTLVKGNLLQNIIPQRYERLSFIDKKNLFKKMQIKNCERAQHTQTPELRLQPNCVVS